MPFHLDLNNIDVDVTITGTPIDVDREWTVFEDDISCAAHGAVPAITAEATVLFDIEGSVTINFGVAVEGTIVPFDISYFGVVVGMSQMHTFGDLRRLIPV